MKTRILFKSFPLAFVVAHQRLVIEAIDLDRHRLDVLRECEHRHERLIVEKLQTRRRVPRDFKCRRARERKAPQAKSSAPPCSKAARKNPPLRASG